MPFDVDAIVLENKRLSPDYNVVALDAPQIAAATAPGQFVMIKLTRGLDPLLRRPFSVFEILRDARGTPTGISLLNKRVGIGTAMLYGLERGDRIACLGPLGRPFTPVDPPMQAWMIAGGVGLAPFATLAEALTARGTPTTLFYGGRRSVDLYRLDFFERLGVGRVLTTEDGSLGEPGFVTAPLERACEALTSSERVMMYVCGPTLMMHVAARIAAAHRLPAQVSLEQVMGCGLGGCYSCVVLHRSDDGRPEYVRSCLAGPVFNAERIVWEALVH
jgi:dihydroorotate dehydrogenase electron transfer subunit